MQILNNSAAFTEWMYYSANSANLLQSMQKLSSGLRIVHAADDPTGSGISARLSLQAGNCAAAEQNIQNAISYTQTADAQLQQVQNVLGRMSELATSAADTSKSPTDLANLQTEFSQLQSQLTSISSTSTYNKTQLFNQGGMTVQIGPNSGQTLSISGMGVSSALSTPAASGGASGALSDNLATSVNLDTVSADVSAASDAISGIRATLGAQGARLQNALSSVTVYESNIRSAISQLRDVDMAKEATNFAKFSLLTQVSAAMLAQANTLPQNVLRLF